jgi:hypothetical protein
MQETFEDAKWVIRAVNQRWTAKTMVNWGATEDLAVPAPLVTTVVLLLKDTNIIWHGNRVGTPVYVKR